MKSQEPQEKKFRQLSDEELEKVTGGIEVTKLEAADSEECKDPKYQCDHPQECKHFCAYFG